MTGEVNTRTATVRSRFEDSETAEILASSVRVDNTPEIDTRVEVGGDDGATVVTTVSRETTGGLQSTLDDYVVNLTVAEKIVQLANQQQTDTNTEYNS
ncbi:KEOPS complex subunit Pcc1 [Halorussus halophilus]|uniref:KEOPS complex subunit Pcc1 n=1 Tax=Halorussus halophilus TaxID=2650975 RepID=UPI001300FA81|nr:KEOPS complex subunit Pcc1 [Halorussus halophilus]